MVTTTDTYNDSISSPHHYAPGNGKKECIDIIKTLLGNETCKHFMLANVYKYAFRYTMKNGLEDLKKARRYVEMYSRMYPQLYDTELCDIDALLDPLDSPRERRAALKTLIGYILYTHNRPYGIDVETLKRCLDKLIEDQ